MLDEVEREGKESIVSWNPDGLTFKVHKHERFASEVLPKHFKQSKYKSFQRQLNFYSFQRVVSGPLEGSYGHPLFIKGNPESCKSIKRLQSTEGLSAPSYKVQAQEIAPFMAAPHEPLAFSSNRVMHEMNVADMASLFQQHPADDVLLGCTPDDIISLLNSSEQDQSQHDLRRNSALFALNTRLSLGGPNSIPMLPTNFTEL